MIEIATKTTPGRRRLAVALVLVASLMAAATWTWARSGAAAPRGPRTILDIDIKHPGGAFPVGTVGLSTDAIELSSGHLTASDAQLVRLMRLLGPSVLRVGGGSVDLSWWTSNGEAQPSWADNTVTPAKLYALRSLLEATGWRVLLGVDFGHFEPTRAADEARVASQIFGSRLVGIEIGNEPNGYLAPASRVQRPRGYGVGEYLREAETYRQALAAAAPGVAIDGPALSRPRWLKQIGASASLFTVITQHYYPDESCASAAPGSVSAPTSSELLSPSERQVENETLTTLAQVGALAGRPTLIGEAGTGPCHGSSLASAAFASSLWALDWTLRAASKGVTGVYFHGHFGLCGPDNQSPICAPSMAAARAREAAPQPEYYGMLAAARLEGGRFLTTNLIAPAPASSSLTAWATLGAHGRVTVAIDNLATSGQTEAVWIRMPRGYTASQETLAGPSVEATSGVALGGAQIAPDGRWHPRTSKLGRQGRYVRVLVRPASAILVTLQRSRRHR